MRRFAIVPLLCVSLIGLPMVAGCDETISHEKETEVKDDGTKVTEEKKVTKDEDTGEVTKTEEKTVDKPNDR
jgi:hypothetical protein